EKRRLTLQEDPEIAVAVEIQNQRYSHNLFAVDMMKMTREKSAPDPNAGNVPENTLLKEEKKAELPVNVVDMKNAEQQLDVTKLKEGKKEVVKNKTEQKKKEELPPEDRSLPAELKETLQSIANDKRWASGYYKGIKEAAKKLLSLDLNDNKQGKQVFSTMAELMNSAILYRDKRPGKRLLRKGRERAQWVDSLMAGMKDFTLDKNPVYMYNITREWQDKLVDKKGYPAHLKKWMKAEAEKIPTSIPDMKLKVSEHTFAYYVSTTYASRLKEMGDKDGWQDAVKKTNNQATRIAGVVSGYAFGNFHTDGTAADEESQKLLDSKEANMKRLQSTVPAGRAEALNGIIKKYLEIKITPEMFAPEYLLSHLSVYAKLSSAFTLWENVFGEKSDKVNAAYLKTLPKRVRRQVEFVDKCLNVFQAINSVVGQFTGVSEHGLRQSNDETKEFLEEQKKYSHLIKQLSDIMKGKPGKLQVVEYKRGMAVQEGVIYYSDSKKEGMPKNTILVPNGVSNAVMNALARLTENLNLYKDHLNDDVDMSEELTKGGTGVNDELVKDVELQEGEGSAAVMLADKQTQFYRDVMKGIGAEVDENHSVLYFIQLAKDVSLRNEKIQKVLDTNKDLTEEQITSLTDELNANKELIHTVTQKEVRDNMVVQAGTVAKSLYFEDHKAEGRAAVPKAMETEKKTMDEVRKKMAEAGI
ncbi:MAG: hypothetical protein IJU93_01550, partial [Lachnospiraceae bacterium]|nr:hypothetical protein [Lachnospiraceae bacterium]